MAVQTRSSSVHNVLTQLALLILAIGVLSAAGCGNGSALAPPITPAAKAQFGYTANLQSANLSGYAVDSSSGLLTPLAGFPIASGVNPVFVIHDPLSHYLIVADIATDMLRVYAINGTTGMLTEVQPSPYLVGREPRALAMDPMGRFVYVAHQSLNGVVTAFSMNEAGVLTPVPGSPFSTGGNAPSIGCSVVVDPSGKFVFVVDTSNVYSFGVDSSTGALRLIATAPGPTTGGGLAVDPAGKFLYAVGSGSNSIFAFTINPTTGEITPSTPSPLALQDGAYTISLDTSGRFAYTVEQGQTLVAYSVQNGILTSLGGSYSGALGSPQLTIDPTGSFIYAPQDGTVNSVSGFRINASGTLSGLPGSPTPSGQWPFSMTITSQ
jgi:6-phosphogluconolactonase